MGKEEREILYRNAAIRSLGDLSEYISTKPQASLDELRAVLNRIWDIWIATPQNELGGKIPLDLLREEEKSSQHITSPDDHPLTLYGLYTDLPIADNIDDDIIGESNEDDSAPLK